MAAAGDGEHNVAHTGALFGPGKGGYRPRVDVEHCEVAGSVCAVQGALHGTAVGKGYERRGITEVVSVREHAIGCYHEAGASAVTPNGDS